MITSHPVHPDFNYAIVRQGDKARIAAVDRKPDDDD